MENANVPTLNPVPCFEIDISTIQVTDRIRKDFGEISDLANSIASEGLIQPIVVTSSHRLVAGERRLRAHKHLGLSTIKAVYIEVLDEAHLTRLEATENIDRKDFSWQERVLAIDKVHRRMSVGAMLKSEAWGVRETGRLLSMAKSPVGFAIFVAEYLHKNDEEICRAESLADAYRIVVKRREEEANALLVKSSIPKTPGQASPVKKELKIPSVDFFTPVAATFVPGVSTPDDTDEMPGAVTITQAKPAPVIPLSQMLLKQDGFSSLSVLEGLGAGCCDHIITDPPYGIDMDNLQQSGSGQDVTDVAKEHDVEGNWNLLHKFVPLAYRALRDKGFLVMWADQMLWQDLYDISTAAGFSVQRWPLTWVKTSSCSNQAAQYNFTKNTEIAIVCRKGNATLVRHQPGSVYTGGNDEARLLGHPFAKPEGLWKWVYEAVAMRGADVLDPFVGVGSSMIPAIKLGLRPRGIECSDVHYGRLTTNIQSLYKTYDATTVFN